MSSLWKLLTVSRWRVSIVWQGYSWGATSKCNTEEKNFRTLKRLWKQESFTPQHLCRRNCICSRRLNHLVLLWSSLSSTSPDTGNWNRIDRWGVILAFESWKDSRSSGWICSRHVLSCCWTAVFFHGVPHCFSLQQWWWPFFCIVCTVVGPSASLCKALHINLIQR